MTGSIIPLIWVALSVMMLLVLQRRTHKYLHALAFVLTGKRNWAVILYALILLPGVLLHEASHWIAAKLLGVKTGSFSILPKSRANGVIQLGYVEYYKPKSVRTIRESAIGLAPVLSGTFAVFLIATQIFDLPDLARSFSSGVLDNMVIGLDSFLSTRDILIWLYLLFAISNTMLPSASDRKAWPILLLVFGIIIVAVFIIGLGGAIWTEINQPVAEVASFFALAFSVALLLDLIALPVIVILQKTIARIRNVRLVMSDFS